MSYLHVLQFFWIFDNTVLVMKVQVVADNRLSYAPEIVAWKK